MVHHRRIHHPTRLDLLEQRLQQDEARLAGMAVTNALNQGIAKMQDQARNFLRVESALWNQSLNKTRDAIHMASQYYTEVLAAKEPPGLGQIIFGMAFGVLAMFGPEFAIMGMILTPSDKAERKEAIAKGFEASKILFEAMTKYQEIQEARKAEESRGGAAALQSGFLRKLLTEVGAKEDLVVWSNITLSTYIEATPTFTVYPTVVSNWTQARLTLHEHYKTPSDETADQVGLLLLYDMLRQYTKHLVTVKLDVGVTQLELSKREALEKDVDVEFEGLEPAKRKVMYGHFNRITWWGKDPQRPPVRNWRELLQNWEFREG